MDTITIHRKNNQALITNYSPYTWTCNCLTNEWIGPRIDTCRYCAFHKDEFRRIYFGAPIFDLDYEKDTI